MRLNIADFAHFPINPSALSPADRPSVVCAGGCVEAGRGAGQESLRSQTGPDPRMSSGEDNCPSQGFGVAQTDLLECRERIRPRGETVPAADFSSSASVGVCVCADSGAATRPVLLHVRTRWGAARFRRAAFLSFCGAPVMRLDSKHNDVCPEGDGARV